MNKQGSDKKTTVLDYVIRSAFEKKETTLLEFPDDLAQVAEAERVPAREVEKEILKLKAQLEEILVTLRMENENLETAQKEASQGGDTTMVESLTKFTQKLESFYYGEFCRKWSGVLWR